MKKFVSITLALAMSMSLAACGADSSSDASSGSQSSSDAASGEKVVKIGVFEPATGDSGAGGKQEMLGMQYANHMTPTVDIGGETYKVELVYADNGSDSAKAPTAASELVSKDVSLVLGTYGSSCAMAGGPIFGEAGLAAIGVTCTNPGVTAGNDYYFRICFLDPFQGTVLANFAQEKFSAKKAYCLGELGNEYDQGLIKYFTDAFDGEVITDSFPTTPPISARILPRQRIRGLRSFSARCPLPMRHRLSSWPRPWGWRSPSSAPIRWTATRCWRRLPVPMCSCMFLRSIRRAALPNSTRASRPD